MCVVTTMKETFCTDPAFDVCSPPREETTKHPECSPTGPLLSPVVRTAGAEDTSVADPGT